MENKKYEFTGVAKETWEGTLHQIRAIRDFRNVKAGDIGGWIEKEENLSHDGDCWVCENAKVYGDAEVCENAEVYGDAEVFGDAVVFGDAEVYGDAVVYGDAEVCENAKVTTTVNTFGNAFIYKITVTDKHIKIGCQQHLKNEWKAFEDREIIKMDGKKALEFWRMFKPVLQSLGLFEEV